jgi:predicted enzyme related to lactoylglutathione lyase
MIEKGLSAANKKGFGNIAFLVKDVEAILNKVISFGGSAEGGIVIKKLASLGTLTFIYVIDPEGNLIELQNMKKNT